MVSVSCKQSTDSRNTRLLTFKFGKRYKRNRHQRYLSLSKLGSDYVNGGKKLRFVITYQERPALLFATARVFDTNLVMYRLPHEKKITGLPQI